jgi:hypothetical protein
MNAPFKLVLEYVAGDHHLLTFRLAFESSTDRLLLPYPEVTGLTFTSPVGETLGPWKTRFLVSGAPRDEFVLNPDSRIAFDLKAHINTAPDKERRWTAEIGTGTMNAHFAFKAKPDLERYEALSKHSRIAAITKPWGGSLESNEVQFLIPQLAQ